MPVVGIPVNMLLERIGTKLDRDDLVEHLQHLGCDVEGYAVAHRYGCARCDNVVEITETENAPVLCDRCNADFREHPEQLQDLGETDVIRMELLAVRPDMFDPGGLARMLRNYLEESSELVRYELAPPQVRVQVDPSVDSADCRRPSIACAIVRGITLSDELIKVVMKMQENLHWAMGRDRKHASIGVYDLGALSGDTFAYKTVGPQELRFVPLGYDPAQADSAITPQAILEEHPKGMAYARLLKEFARYPLLCDGQGQVLSLPPIINSEPTRVRRSTTDFFIDVTGTEERIVNKCLNVLVTSLAELDTNVRLEQVTIVYPHKETMTPDLSPQLALLDVAATAATIGIPLTAEDAERHLRQMGHEVVQDGGGQVTVKVPAYRNDIMHPVDLMEDVAIAFGYHNIEPVLVPTMTVGKEREIEHYAEVTRRAMTGLGYQENLTLLLSSQEQSFDALLLPHDEACVLIDNPISVEQTIIRTSLLPGFLDTLSVNTNHELPQRLFEVGNITKLAPETETGAQEQRFVTAGAIGPKVDYSEIRSACEALLRELGWTMEVEADATPCFIPGRGAKVFACRDGQRKAVGLMGELHPQVLENFKLIQPTAAFELNLELLV